MSYLNERQEEMMKLIRKNRFMTVKELSGQLFASEATIRRDLQKLDELRIISRSHGGASVNSEIGDYPLAIFNKSSLEEKRAIASNAAPLVHDSDVIFLDATSTVATLLDYLQGIRDLTIFTNGLETAQRAVTITSETYLIGGKVRGMSSCCYGSFAERFLDEIYFDSMFFSVPSLSTEGELTHYSPDLVPLYRSIMQRAKRRYLMCIGSKYGSVKAYRICNCSELTGIISDTILPPHINQINVKPSE